VPPMRPSSAIHSGPAKTEGQCRHAEFKVQSFLVDSAASAEYFYRAHLAGCGSL
jgi:hypothetical protein